MRAAPRPNARVASAVRTAPSARSAARGCVRAGGPQVGRMNYVDRAQVDHVRHVPRVRVVEHPTFHHNVPAFLERTGALVTLLKAELLALLLEER